MIEGAAGDSAVLSVNREIEPTPGEYMVYDERPDWIRNWEKTVLNLTFGHSLLVC